jgi:hypothetical protein
LVAPENKKAEISKIDRDKLRAKLRRLGDEYVFYMLDDALDVLSDAQLAEFVGQYIKLEEIAPDDSSGTGERSLRDVVAGFDAACRRGEYYVSFAVNSKNCMETSSGTRSFIADCQRLFVRSLVESAEGDPVEVRFAFDTLTGLLRHIDEGHDDIVFFADEGGSWLVHVDWKKVFPAWFGCLARTAEPEEFAHVVVDAVDRFEVGARETHLAAARKVANPEQRRALAARAARASRGRR